MDTAIYPIAKATTLQGLLVNNATSAGKAGQYYNAPQPITVEGFRFYAWKTDANGGITINAICQIYNASPIDSLPIGQPLATVNVPLDTSFGGGDLSILQKVAVFSSPVTVTGPYVVVVGNPTPNSIGIVVNDYQVSDGQGEWLGMAELGSTWSHGYEVVLGAFPFDCDVLLDPMVTYDLSANFSHTPSCVAAAGNVNFVNTSSPILRDRMYNAAVFLGLGGLSSTWDFGDGTIVQDIVNQDTSHGYAAAGNYIVTLVDTLYQWGGGACVADTFITLGGPPIAQYSSFINGNIVDFTDMTGSVNATYAWDFGDGNTSTTQNPQHTYSALGNYTACLTITDACGTDSVCHLIPVVIAGLVSDPLGRYFQVFPNPSAGDVHLSIELPEMEKAQVHIYNSLGMMVQQVDLGEVKATNVDLSLPGLASGQYLVELRTPTTFGTRRIQLMR
jgi:PKD repeat protein